MADSALKKHQRLLKPVDYSSVFGGADYKISDRSILFLARHNQLGYARIGLVMAKKNIRLAVQRNRIKRQVRESFRVNNVCENNLDIVVMARRGLDQMDNQAIRSLLNNCWHKLAQKHAVQLRPDTGTGED